MAGKSDIISPVCCQCQKLLSGRPREKNTHIVTYVPASTSLTLPIPLGTRFCDASLALSVGRGGERQRGMRARGKERGREAEEALY